MRREHLIILGGVLVTGVLITANLRVLRTEEGKRSMIVSQNGTTTSTSERLFNPARDERADLSVAKTGAVPENVQKSDYQLRKESGESSIAARARTVNEAFKRAHSKAGREASAFFRATDWSRFFNRSASGSGNNGAVRRIDSTSADTDETARQVALAFVRWTQADPEGAAEWAATQDLQPVMTALLKDAAVLAVDENAQAATVEWIEQINDKDLKEVAAWTFFEELLRADPEGSEAFLEESKWLSDHEKIRIRTIALQ